MRIDSHQHFWQYQAEEYNWIGEQESILKAHFQPDDLLKLTRANHIDGSIAVQARQSDEETQWLINLARSNDFIKGVVGWVDLRSDNLEETLKQYQNETVLKGFRHVLQDEPDKEFMLRDDFIRGLYILEKHHYTYDLLIYANQLPQAIELVKRLPDLRVVVDHIAKPAIAHKQGFAGWQIDIHELAQHQNVFCKLSGMVTEAKIADWQASDFTPYLQAVLSAFGPERVMFGSDWPVCLLAADYKSVLHIVEDFVKRFYPNHFDNIFGLNAQTFYQL